MSKTLYEQDFQLWLKQIIDQLQQGEFNQLDIDNLIEELNELEKSEKRTLESNFNDSLCSSTQIKHPTGYPNIDEEQLVSLNYRTSSAGSKKLMRYAFPKTLS